MDENKNKAIADAALDGNAPKVTRTVDASRGSRAVERGADGTEIEQLKFVIPTSDTVFGVEDDADVEADASVEGHMPAHHEPSGTHGEKLGGSGGEQMVMDVYSPEADQKESYPKPQTLGDFIRQSVIVYVFATLIGWIYKSFRQSFISRALTSADAVDQAQSGSAVSGVFGSSAAKNTVYRIKYSVRNAYSNSLLLEKVSGLGSSVLSMPVRCYGAFLAAAGLGSVGLYFSNLYWFKFFDISAAQLLISIILCVPGLMLLPFGCTLARFIRKSYILRHCIFGFFGINPDEGDEEARPHSLSGAVLLGLCVAALSLFLPLSGILIGIAIAVYAAVVIKSPEAGVVGLILLLPIVDIGYTVTAILFIWISLIFKLLCGRRTLSLKTADIFTAIFGLCLLLGEIVSVGGWSGVGLKTLACSVYLAVVAVIRNPAWVKRCNIAVAVDCAMLSIYYIMSRLPGDPLGLNVNDQPLVDVGGFAEQALGNTAVTAVWVAMMFIPMLALFISSDKNSERFVMLIVTLLAFYIMCIGLNTAAWLALIIAFSVFVLLFRKKYWCVILAAVVISPFFSVLGLPSVRELAEPMTDMLAERAPLWYQGALILRDRWATGIGAREQAFGAFYSGGGEYSNIQSLWLDILLSLGAIGLFVFLVTLFFFFQNCFSHGNGCTEKRTATRYQTYSGMCAVIFALLVGFVENVWYDHRLAVFFWLIMGLTVAMGRAERKQEFRSNEDSVIIPDLDY